MDLHLRKNHIPKFQQTYAVRKPGHCVNFCSRLIVDLSPGLPITISLAGIKYNVYDMSFI